MNQCFNLLMPFPQIQGLPEGASITGLLDYDIYKVEWNKYELKSGVTVCFLREPQIFTPNRLNPTGAFQSVASVGAALHF